MQMKNNNGPRTDPKGTPDVISLIVEACLPMDTNVVFPLGMSGTNHLPAL